MLPPSSDEEEEFEGEESEKESSEEEEDEEEDDEVHEVKPTEDEEGCSGSYPNENGGHHFDVAMAAALMGVPQSKPVKKVAFSACHE